VLLDNCVDRHFAALVKNHEVSHARDHGWHDLEHGKLLEAAAAAGFEAMATVDKNIRYQRNLAKMPVAVVEIDAVRSHIDELARFAPHLAGGRSSRRADSRS